MGHWTIPTVDGLAPGPRGAHAAVAVGSRMLVFGGADRAPVAYNDLWMLETAGGQLEWTCISARCAPGCQLLPRSGATLTVVGDSVLLFGGTEPNTGLCFNDVKCLDLQSWQWSDVEAQGTAPPPRHSHSTVCLAGACLLVYGGAGYQGPLSDVWLFNFLQRSWSRPKVTGAHPAAREMHSACMVDGSSMLVYGGRGAENKVLCDLAVLDTTTMRWTRSEPTPFSRCAHSCVLLSPPSPTQTAHAAAPQQMNGLGASTRNGHSAGMGDGVNGMNGVDPVPDICAANTPHTPNICGLALASPTPLGNSSGAAVPGASATAAVTAADDATMAEASTAPAEASVLIYGGFSGEAVEGDVLRVGVSGLDIELLSRGPRQSDRSKATVVPPIRFAHSGMALPGWRKGDAVKVMVVFGGVNPKEDLQDVAVWFDS